MFPLLLTSALAADPDTIVERWSPPYTLAEAANGDLRVQDRTGDALPAVRVLELLESDDAERYRGNRRNRKIGAFALWVGGSVAFTVGLGNGVFDSGLPAAIGGLGAIGGGYALLYLPQAERLDHWATRDELEQGLAGYGLTAPGSVPTLGIGPASPTLERPTVVLWSVDDKGRVRDRAGRTVSVEAVAAALGDTERGEAWRRWRREQYGTWLTALGGGVAVTITGAMIMEQAEGMRVYNAGLGTLALGGALTAGGVAGLAAIEGGWHVPRWFSHQELEQAVRASRGIADAEPAARRPLVSVMPTIAPGYLGVSGTF